jgi:hypothetical protein
LEGGIPSCRLRTADLAKREKFKVEGAVKLEENKTDQAFPTRSAQPQCSNTCKSPRRAANFALSGFFSGFSGKSCYSIPIYQNTGPETIGESICPAALISNLANFLQVSRVLHIRKLPDEKRAEQ